MNTQIRFLARLLILGLFLGQGLHAQDKIPSSVLGNGAAAASGANNKIVGTLGQAAIGVTGSSDASHQAGFWYSTIDLVTSVEQIEDELLQLDANKRYWAKRLEEIRGELKTEPTRIEDLYTVKARRVEPVGLVYLWPVTG